MPPFESTAFPTWALQVFCCLFFAILFLQSGTDKVLDWKGNLGWMTPHFARSPLRSMVPLLLGVLTVLELTAGVLNAAGVVQLFVSGASQLGYRGALVAGLALLALFLGQRLAKDYAGAAGLVPYFLTALASAWLLRPL
jgi:hypothetical protein